MPKRSMIEVFAGLDDIFFCFNVTPTTEIYTLSLHDALPISLMSLAHEPAHNVRAHASESHHSELHEDRKSTRLNSSHSSISYAVFCLKKKRMKFLPVSGYCKAC